MSEEKTEIELLQLEMEKILEKEAETEEERVEKAVSIADITLKINEKVLEKFSDPNYILNKSILDISPKKKNKGKRRGKWRRN